jgi:hypothetical protein
MGPLIALLVMMSIWSSLCIGYINARRDMAAVRSAGFSKTQQVAGDQP